MFHTRKIGQNIENLVSSLLLRRGGNILAHNFRCGRCEIDLIFEKNGIVYFIEVKYRSSSLFGYPEQAVTRKKIRHIQHAAERFLRLTPLTFKEVVYLIAAVTRDTKGNLAIRFFEVIPPITHM